jgi:hypothetical protein
MIDLLVAGSGPGAADLIILKSTAFSAMKISARAMSLLQSHDYRLHRKALLDRIASAAYF